MTNELTSSPASLRIRGHDAQPADLTVERRPKQARVTRAGLALFGFLLLAPVVFFIPPHLPWVLIAVTAGVYFAYKQWTGEYVVHQFRGTCPRCNAELRIDPGTKVKLPLQMDCYECHHQPVLELRPAA